MNGAPSELLRRLTTVQEKLASAMRFTRQSQNLQGYCAPIALLEILTQKLVDDVIAESLKVKPQAEYKEVRRYESERNAILRRMK